MTDLKAITSTTGQMLGIALALAIPSASVLAAPPAGYELLFADEFENNTLNTMKWQDRYPWGRTHNHEAYMAPENVILGDGTATLLAERVSHPNSNKEFTSGVISTGYNKFTFTGGYVESRILLPDTVGSWPAFWGLYTGWPPEADIMEYPIGAYTQSEYHTAFHYSSGSGPASGAGKVNPGGVGDLGGTYHTFGMEWKEDDYVRFYFDGTQVSSFGTDSAIAQMEYMYLILNYAVGGWPGTPSQAQWANGHTDETKIDWVRVWQQTAEGTEHTWTTNGDGSWGDTANWAGGAPKLGTQVANFGTVAAATANVDWTNLKTVGDLRFDGTTAYTIGNGDESLTLASTAVTSWSTIHVDDASGSANHTIDSQLEVWSRLSIQNEAVGSNLRLNGDIIGDGKMLFTGTSEGSSTTTVAGDVYNDAGVEIQSNATVSLTGKLFADGTPGTDARLKIGNQGRLTLNSFNYNGNLGSLPEDSQYIEIDGGEIFMANSATDRGFTIKSGGATIESSPHPLASVNLLASAAPEKQIISNEGGDLTLAGGNGAFNKSLPGSGGLNKTGAGTWTTNAVHTYTGNTTIEQGTLNLTGSASIDNSAMIDIRPGATLNVSGLAGGFNVANGQVLNNDSDTTVVGDVTAASGSTVSGNGTFANNLTAQAGSTIAIGSQAAADVVTLGSYEFTAQSLAATDANPLDGITLSNISIGTGLGNLFDNGSDGNSLRFSGDDTENGTGTAMTNNAFISFTVTNNSGSELVLDSAELDYAATNPGSYTVGRFFSDVKGFADIFDDRVGNFGYEGSLGDPLIAHDVVKFTDSSTEFGNNVSASDFTIVDGGSITFYLPWIDNSSITGRYTDVDNILLTGTVSMESSDLGELTVLGDYTQDPGAMLEIDILDTGSFDRLAVTGVLNAGGGLSLSMVNGAPALEAGDSFDILDFASSTGSFDVLDLPSLAAGLNWDTSALLTTGVLEVISALQGDLDGDGFVGINDLNLVLSNWNQNVPPGNPLADPSGDGFVGIDDLNAVLGNWNAGTPPTSNANIPEPTTLVVFGVGAAAFCTRRK